MDNDIAQYSFQSHMYYLVAPVVTIAIALLFRQVVLALVVGIILGTFLLNGFSVESFFAAVDTHLMGTLTDNGNMSVIVFSMLIGGMVALLRKNGSLNGVVNKVSGLARSAMSAQLSVWTMGVLIFFDDYANSLIVGNTMRSITDRYHVSREKLAYIVDSTAAPVASIALITTWVGTQMTYFNSGIETLGLQASGVSSVSFFLSSLQYAFYPFLSLAFILMLVFTGRDYGPMYRAELQARKEKKSNVVNENDTLKVPTKSGWLAVVPVLSLLIITVFQVWQSGKSVCIENGQTPTAIHILSNADIYQALIWGAFGSLVIAVILSLFLAYMKLKQVIEHLFSGFGELLEALIILVLAWTFGDIIKQMGTGEYLGTLISGNVSLYLFPAIIFLLSGVIAFATGSSWSTMSVMYSIVWPMCGVMGIGADHPELVYHIGSVVLAGSVLGDHCSPISDTTILSSMSSGCDHVSHVRTQMPYALTVAGVSILLSVIATMGVPFYLNFFMGMAMLYFIVRYFGERVN